MNKICKIFREKDVGAIGIGAMIVFIAMILVAGIAASVLIQTSSTIELQAMKTGQQTTREVSGGIQVYDIEGKINVSGGTKYDLKYLAIGVKARAGSGGMDLNNSFVIISDGSQKALLRYGGYNDADLYQANPSGDVFDILNSAQWNKTDRETFGIAVIQDYDGSIKQTSPTMNRGDKAIIFIRCEASLNGAFGREIPERTPVFGQVIPEVGSPGVIKFTTPMSYFDEIYDLQ
ncbi:MAG: flagellin [Thermoplasmatales archaeon]|nr:MAG: flagellin [Thermoplasmatales archaeon]